MLFSTIYDTEYAMVDRDDDIRVGAKSTAILFGDADLPILGVLMVTFLLTMALVAQRGHLHWPYFAGLGVAALLFAWQQWIMRARERDALFRRVPQQRLGRHGAVGRDCRFAGHGRALRKCGRGDRFLIQWPHGCSRPK